MGNKCYICSAGEKLDIICPKCKSHIDNGRVVIYRFNENGKHTGQILFVVESLIASVNKLCKEGGYSSDVIYKADEISYVMLDTFYDILLRHLEENCIEISSLSNLN